MASVLDLVKHYQHSIEKYPNDEQKVLKCIDKLYNLSVTVQHLQETGVGRTVNALRKEPGDVGQAARALVYKWKTMVAAEESDQEENKNDTTNYNGHENGRYYENDSSDSRSKHDKRDKSQRAPKTEEKHHKQSNGDYGNKRKYQSSEDEESETKKCKYSSTKDNGYKVKSEPKTARDSSESEMDSQADSSQSDSESEDSQSSEEERQPEIKMAKENQQSSSTKHSTSSRDKHKTDSYSDTSMEKSEKHHSTNSSDMKSLPDARKQSSKDKSHNSHSHKSSKENEHHTEKKEREHRSLETEKRHKSESSSKHSDKHRSSHSSEKQKSSSSTDKHTSSSSLEKQKSHSNPEKHRSSSNVEKHRSSSSSDKNKSNTTEKHKNNSDKAHSSKSEKDKHKLPSEKEISNDKHKSKESSSSSKDKHTSSSREKTKDKSSSSKEKDHSGKSEKKHSSSKDSKSSDEKRKSESSNREKSNRKSKDKSSSASFAEALGMVSPAKPKKKSVFTKDSASPNSNDDMSPATLLAPTAKLAPLPTLEISALPEISPNYRPRPPPKFLPHFTDEDAMNAGISSKNQRTKVYSGNKVIGKIPTLYEMCVHILQEHIDSLEYTGGVPYDILKPVVDRATAQQLFVLEHYNPYLMEDTDHLWQKFCEKNFRNKKRQEMETWREMYMRCQEEQEIKLKSLTANIKIAQEAKKAPIKQTKMAYVDSVVKPPRNVAKKQAQHGTAFAATASPAARVASLAAAPNVLRGGRPTPVPTVSTSSSFKPKKAPLMQKALQFLRGRKR
ncbi:transcription elongation factor B polypeptide 3 isoform X2 [Vanessa cardui]|uniref:transcription elongation factor B polypeptide 3 isoform X2 n=1 Tax=Vanessa cardui TaxID=171605 RepID=UPI001F12D423|nr:transcription elongation factor B polypeptide 3 isoform X2 [Vanessa cardui]